MKKILVNSFYGGTTSCWLEVKKYAKTNNLCVQMMCDDGPFATITINTSKQLPEDCAAVKTYSENAFVPTMLRKYKLAQPTVIRADGFPVYRFDLKKLAEYEYTAPHLSKIEKFERDFRDALSEAEYAVKYMVDSGTCNMDILWVKLPRMKAEAIEQIAKQNGCCAFKEGSSFWEIGKLFGQGMRNTKAQEVMQSFLQSRGYECYIKYRMD